MLYARISRIALCWVFAVSLTGCGVVTTLGYMTAGRTTKVQLLQDRAAKFSRAMYWGSPADVAEFVQPESLSQVLDYLQQSGNEERLVEVNVTKLELDKDDADSGTVRVRLRYFKSPTYLVQLRSEEQRWQFSTVDGWQLHSIEAVETPESEKEPGGSSFRRLN